MIRILNATLILALVTSFSGCGKSGGSSGGATPEATFESFKASMQAKDYKKGFNHLTPESQDMMLGGMAMMVGMIASFDAQKGPEVQKILDDHGVKKLDAAAITPSGDPKDAMKQLTSGVKDKPACIAAIMTWMEKNADKKGDSPAEEFGMAELVEVKIEGDTAKGTIKTKKDGEEKSQPADFKKVGGVWLIDMSKSLEQTPPGAGAAPPTN